MPDPWQDILEQIRPKLDAEDFRRWFGATSYASDSGDQITVWVPTEAIRRHVSSHFLELLDEARAAVGRSDAHLRFVVTGVSDDEDEDGG